MNAARSRPTGLSISDHFAIIDLLAGWNWAVDAQDGPALAAMCLPGMTIDDNGTQHDDTDKFLQAQAARGLGLQRWTDHPRLFRDGDDIRVESLAMITVRHSTGGTGLVWSGYSQDRLCSTPEGWRFAERSFRAWDGAVLARFPRFAPTGDQWRG